ncbi:MAG: hypothetical protein AABP62_05100 [Planctomycetota bacterium]
MGDPSGGQLKFHIVKLLGSLPWLVVMLVGGAVCLRSLSTRPREGWLVGGAIALSLFATFGVENVFRMLHLILELMGLRGTGVPGTDSIWLHQVLNGLPASIVQAGAWGLILYAAFGEGSGPRSKYLIEDERSEQKLA